MLTGAGRTLAWDPDNRLASVTMPAGGTTTFAYDHTGTRVRKTTAAGVMRYPFAGYEVDSTGFITKHILAGDERIAVKRADGQTLFYHSDHLGGVHVLTNQSGERVQLVEYDPWGKVTRQEGSADLTHRFTGEDFDPESGLLYFGGRYYDPALARFTIPDPYIPRPSDPQAFNRYAYVRNNPVTRIDPSGYEDADADSAGCCAASSDSDDAPATLDATATITFTITFSAPAPAPVSTDPGLAALEAAIGGVTGVGPGTGPALAGVAVGTDAAGGDDASAGPRLAMAGAGVAIRVAPYLAPAARAASAAVGAAIGGLLGSAASNTGQQPGSTPSSPSDSTTSNKGDNPAVPHSTPAPPDPNDPDNRNPRQDQKLNPNEITKLKKHGIDPHDLKNSNPRLDLFKDKNGNIYVKPKDGSGFGEFTGYNINQLP